MHRWQIRKQDELENLQWQGQQLWHLHFLQFEHVLLRELYPKYLR